MDEAQLLPHLFRTEYRKIIAVLCKLFGIEHIEIAEDIVSETFLVASETWGQKGLPKNPVAWLYTVSKNKTRDLLKHNAVFYNKVVPGVTRQQTFYPEFELDLSDKNILDSQLQMMFTICHPCIAAEAQIGLALNILCGFGCEEIADAFLVNKEIIYKRLSRAKAKLRIEKIPVELPSPGEISNRLQAVLTTMYLLFNEGYYSTSANQTLRKELCLESMRLTYLLSETQLTNTPEVNALLSLMCFHASRFEARTSETGEMVLYDDQDLALWDAALIAKGEHFLNQSARGSHASRYHLEAAIAYWHTKKNDTPLKWENILQLYDNLLTMEYSPVVALNRTYALAKCKGNSAAIAEAEKLPLPGNHLYHSLLAHLYLNINPLKTRYHLELAFALAKSVNDKKVIAGKLKAINTNLN